MKHATDHELTIQKVPFPVLPWEQLIFTCAVSLRISTTDFHICIHV